jgi:hypothetical protein
MPESSPSADAEMQPTSLGTESAVEGVLLAGLSNLTTNTNRNGSQKKMPVRKTKNLLKAVVTPLEVRLNPPGSSGGDSAALLV